MSALRATGSYLLVCRLPVATTIEVGRLGRFALPPGHYFYAGSAMSGLDARLARHLRSEKKLRWHIDYLLAVAPPVAAYVTEGKSLDECSLAARLLSCDGAEMGAPRFGSSDCRCPTHLIYLGHHGWPAWLERELQRWTAPSGLHLAPRG